MCIDLIYCLQRNRTETQYWSSKAQNNNLSYLYFFYANFIPNARWITPTTVNHTDHGHRSSPRSTMNARVSIVILTRIQLRILNLYNLLLSVSGIGWQIYTSNSAHKLLWIPYKSQNIKVPENISHYIHQLNGRVQSMVRTVRVWLFKILTDFFIILSLSEFVWWYP
jgi:hypothetical protein